MTKARRDGFLLLILASALFLAAGFVLESGDSASPDFKGIYYGTRCLLQHADPYKVSEVRRLYLDDAPRRPPDRPYPPNDPNRPFVMVQIYLPGTFLVALPFAFLAWGPAHFLWIFFIVAAFLLAVFLVWNLAADHAPILSSCLLGFLLVNSLVLFTSANPAGIAVGLCVIATWCFLRERFLALGVLCLAFSLTFKPHDAGLVWLYFLLAGGSYRKHALQTLAVTVVLGLAGVLWVSQIAPQWLPEMRANLVENLHSGLDDPGPHAPYARTASTIIDLQTDLSCLHDDPRFYNPISYLVVGALLIVWATATLRSRPSFAMALLALAPVVSLTLLPVYHRAVDAKLLMLAVPACALLFREGGALGRIALLATSAAILFTGDIPLDILVHLSDNLHLSASGLATALLRILLLRPVPLVLLLASSVNLWIYARRSRAHPAVS